MEIKYLRLNKRLNSFNEQLKNSAGVHLRSGIGTSAPGLGADGLRPPAIPAAHAATLLHLLQYVPHVFRRNAFAAGSLVIALQREAGAHLGDELVRLDLTDCARVGIDTIRGIKDHDFRLFHLRLLHFDAPI